MIPKPRERPEWEDSIVVGKDRLSHLVGEVHGTGDRPAA